jgi:hypothetical protein
MLGHVRRARLPVIGNRSSSRSRAEPPGTLHRVPARSDRAAEEIERTGRRAPPAEPDHAAGTQLDLDTTTLDLGDLGAVVWCTGFSGDFSWLEPTLVDPYRQPTRIGCAAGVPGVWYVGLRWLTHRGSATLDGFPTDAATVAHAVRAHLDGSDPRPGSPSCRDHVPRRRQ